MIETLFCVTTGGNTYMYDDTRMLSSLVHPELKKVHEGNSDDAYYCGKYEYLKRNGFFDTPKSAQLKTSKLYIGY